MPRFREQPAAGNPVDPKERAAQERAFAADAVRSDVSVEAAQAVVTLVNGSGTFTSKMKRVHEFIEQLRAGYRNHAKEYTPAIQVLHDGLEKWHEQLKKQASGDPMMRVDEVELGNVVDGMELYIKKVPPQQSSSQEPLPQAA
ncbi:hypothetical protein HZA86_01255 [Candidatus Uhrbacteria bacterium]|nr:hypothetical protein [Candidatus Uhrbacteria bacterium]